MNPATSETFSEKVKNEASQVRCRTMTERQAVEAGAFCAASPEGLSFPSTYVRTTSQACIQLAGLLAKDSFVHLVRGNKIMILQQSFTPFCSLMSACFQDNAKDQLLLDKEFVRCFLRGAFLSCGYCSDPWKSYRAEYRVSNGKMIDLIVAMLEFFGIKPVIADRDSYTLIYFKNGDMVSDFLGVIGATGAVMEFENIRAEKEVNGRVTRTVNCDSGNIKRSAGACAKRGAAFDKLVRAGKVNSLPPELKVVVEAHYINPEASISELAAMMDPPLAKSGMNHRIAKLIEMAENTADI
ncbi:MAG: DNA-binding protein WhiA [Clostridiales bacterium]|nr:DNA-binding protein WhiA [Clostridiales bacterium]